MPRLILVTVGKSDLQVYLRDGTTRKHADRALHEAWLDGSETYYIDGSVVGRNPVQRDDAMYDPYDLERDARGIRVAPAKLHELKAFLTPDDDVIVFGTHRHKIPGDEHTETEPVAAAPLLAAWLGGTFVNLVNGAERVTEEVMAAALDPVLAARPSTHVLVIDTGGPPQMKELVEATARLKYGTRRVRVVKPDLTAYGDREKLAPDRARRAEVIDRLEHGDIEGAWARTDQGQQWHEPVRDLHRWFLDGSPEDGS